LKSARLSSRVNEILFVTEDGTNSFVHFTETLLSLFLSTRETRTRDGDGDGDGDGDDNVEHARGRIARPCGQ
jgi:hypothetical protein